MGTAGAAESLRARIRAVAGDRRGLPGGRIAARALGRTWWRRCSARDLAALALGGAGRCRARGRAVRGGHAEERVPDRCRSPRAGARRSGTCCGPGSSSVPARSTAISADLYGDQRIIDAGVVPAVAASTLRCSSPTCSATLDWHGRTSPASTSCAAPTARCWCSRTTCARPSGATYAMAARRICDCRLPLDAARARGDRARSCAT